jgi:hypothetical protein
MHQLPCSSQAAQARLDDVPFADVRNRYLRHCEDYGASPGALKIKRNELLWICRHLDTRACHGVNMEVLLEIAQKRQNLRGATTAARRVVDIGRPWLRFLGWWRQPTVVSQYQDELDRYIEWMRDDRGFTPPDPRGTIAAECAGSTFDFNEKEAPRSEDQYVYFIDRPVVRDEFEVGPDAIGIAVGQVLAHIIQCLAFPRELRRSDLFPPL